MKGDVVQMKTDEELNRDTQLAQKLSLETVALDKQKRAKNADAVWQQEYNGGMSEEAAFQAALAASKDLARRQAEAEKAYQTVMELSKDDR